MAYEKSTAEDGIVVIHLLEEITDKDNFSIEKEELSNKNPKIVLNLSKFDYINSGEIQKVIQWVLKARKQGGDVKLCSPIDWMKDVFRVIRLSDWVTVTETEEEAKNSFKT